MAQTPAHTPLPWRSFDNAGSTMQSYSQSSGVAGTGDDSLKLVCGCFHDIGGREVAAANASLIVRAVNSHAALVAALEGLLAINDSVTQGLERELREKNIPLARAALSLAKQAP